jgi:hypothetical protein
MPSERHAGYTAQTLAPRPVPPGVLEVALSRRDFGFDFHSLTHAVIAEQQTIADTFKELD